MSNIKMNKLGISLSILLLVLMVLVLVIFSLFTFLTRSSKIGTEIRDPRNVQQLYIAENEINYYVYDIIDRAGSRIDKNGDLKQQFTKNFLEELKRYQVDLNDPNKGYIVKAFNGMESHVNENYVDVSGNLISITLSFNIQKDFQKSMIVNYVYKKKFSYMVK